MRNKRSTGSDTGRSTSDPDTGRGTGTPSPSGAPGQTDFNDPLVSSGSGGLDAARRYAGDEDIGMAGSMGSAGRVGDSAVMGSTGVGGVGGFGTEGSVGGSGGFGTGVGAGAGTDARGPMQQAKDKARDVASQVRHDAADAARSGFRNTANRTAETLGTVAQSLRSSTQQMHEQHQGETIARYFERASDQAQRFADYLRTTEPDQVVSEVQGFARRQPALFLGGAFMLGLMASRFLRATERNQPNESFGGAGQGGYDPAWNTATPRHGDQIGQSWAVVGDRELDTPVSREPTTPPTDQGLGAAGPIGMEGDFGTGTRDDLRPDVNDRPGGFAGPDTR